MFDFSRFLREIFLKKFKKVLDLFVKNVIIHICINFIKNLLKRIKVMENFVNIYLRKAMLALEQGNRDTAKMLCKKIQKIK